MSVKEGMKIDETGNSSINPLQISAHSVISKSSRDVTRHLYCSFIVRTKTPTAKRVRLYLVSLSNNDASRSVFSLTFKLLPNQHIDKQLLLSAIERWKIFAITRATFVLRDKR